MGASIVSMNSPVSTGKYVSGDFFDRVRRNALKRGIYFDLSLEYLDNLLEQQNFKCIYTGAPLDAKTRKSYTASLDRIDSREGYVKGNVQFTLISVNYAKHSSSDEAFLQLVSDIYHYRLGGQVVSI